MKIPRRDFIRLVSGTVTAWPLAAHAQQTKKLPTVGFLAPATPSVAGQWLGAFVQRLRDLGWSEGRNIAIETRWAEGRSERFAELAAEFVRMKVDVIVTWGNETVVTVKQATSAIPIVFATSSDPVRTGLVASLSRPGGNLTGLSVQNPDLASKRLELLHEVVPQLRKLAILGNVGSSGVVLDMHELGNAAGSLGLDIVSMEIRRAADVAPAFGTLSSRPDALFVCGDPLTFTARAQINTLALAARIPSIWAVREAVEAGGLMSYGTNFPDLFKRAAEYVNRILRGAKPAELPVEQPVKFDLVVNLTTARALGLQIPESFLLRADEVIE